MAKSTALQILIFIGCGLFLEDAKVWQFLKAQRTYLEADSSTAIVKIFGGGSGLAPALLVAFSSSVAVADSFALAAVDLFKLALLSKVLSFLAQRAEVVSAEELSPLFRMGPAGDLLHVDCSEQRQFLLERSRDHEQHKDEAEEAFEAVHSMIVKIGSRY